MTTPAACAQEFIKNRDAMRDLVRLRDEWLAGGDPAPALHRSPILGAAPRGGPAHLRIKVRRLQIRVRRLHMQVYRL